MRTRRTERRRSLRRPLRYLRLERASQHGFTLVELMVTSAILSIIMGALAAALIVGLRTTDTTQKRLAESHDTQIVAAYWANDVQSADSLTTTACGAGSPLVSFQYAAAGQIASWTMVTAAGETRLVRRYCASSGASVVEAIMSHFVTPTPAVTCDGGACNVGTPPRPNVVRLDVIEPAGNKYSVSGSRRPYAAGAGPAAKAPMQFGGLGGGSNKQLTISGKGSLTVNGNMYLDCCTQSPQTPGVVISVGGNQQKPQLTVNGTFSIYKYPTVGGCDGCTSGRVVSSNPTPHVPMSFNNHLSDPLAGLPYPDEVAVKNLYGQVAPYTDGLYHGPGVYRTKPMTIDKNVPDLRCRPDNVCFSSAIYVLEAGMLVSGNSTVVGGSNVMFFNGCGTNVWAGACDSGAGSLQFTSNGGTLNIEPATTGTYASVLIFQHRTNTTDLGFSGGISLVSLLGTIYAPGATKGVDLGSGNANDKSRLQVKRILATAMTISGNGDVVVG